MRRTGTTVAAAVALVLGGGWLLTASAAPGDLDACYGTTGGQLRVNVTGTCRPNETPVTLGTSQFSTRVVTETDTMSKTDQGYVTPMCGPGEVVLGGGYTVASIGPSIFVNQDQPFRDHVSGNQGWLILATYTTDEDYVIQVDGYAICASGVTTEAPWIP